uniref:Uncharacterized protein n=1 Tax=Meleagris gallopavo TaxID=9103 RepID=A0A803Y7C9_MELGA
MKEGDRLVMGGTRRTFLMGSLNEGFPIPSPRTPQPGINSPTLQVQGFLCSAVGAHRAALQRAARGVLKHYMYSERFLRRNERILHRCSMFPPGNG